MNNLRTQTNMKKALFTAMAVAVLAILPATAQAVPIVGTLDLAGAVRVSAEGVVEWLPLDGGGDALILNTSTGYFIPIRNQRASELDLGPFPTDTQLGIPGFETFELTSLPGLNFILDVIVSCGASSLNPADECDAGLASPFRFDEDTEGTTVIMNFRGRVIDAANPGEVSTFNAKYDATFTGDTTLELLTRLSTEGFIETSYSARKIAVDVPTAEIPEPATLLTFGAGTALLAAHRRRRAKKSAK